MLDKDSAVRFAKFKINTRPNAISAVQTEPKHSINRPFYPRDAMLARVIVIATCLSVCLSVRHAPVLCQNEES